jgi:hypothetical protein
MQVDLALLLWNWKDSSRKEQSACIHHKQTTSSICLHALQADATFSSCSQLVKVLWNEEFAMLWPQLASCTEPESLKPIASPLQQSLRKQAAHFVTCAYSTMRAAQASEMLGLDHEQLVTGALTSNSRSAYNPLD